MLNLANSYLHKLNSEFFCKNHGVVWLDIPSYEFNFTVYFRIWGSTYIWAKGFGPLGSLQN